MRDDGVKIYCNTADPGGVGTNILQNIAGSGTLQKFINAAYIIVGKLGGVWHPETAALTTLYLATSPEIDDQDISGSFFIPIAERFDALITAKHCPACADRTLQTQLWHLTEQAIKSKL